MSGYPNLFLLYGPNTNGVNSIIFMHEAQANYVMSALRTMRRRAHRRRSTSGARVMDRYNRRIQAAMAGTVWTAGCDNYFRTADGQGRDAAAVQRRPLLAPHALLQRWHYRSRALERLGSFCA